MEQNIENRKGILYKKINLDLSSLDEELNNSFINVTKTSNTPNKFELLPLNGGENSINHSSNLEDNNNENGNYNNVNNKQILITKENNTSYSENELDEIRDEIDESIHNRLNELNESNGNTLDGLNESNGNTLDGLNETDEDTLDETDEDTLDETDEDTLDETDEDGIEYKMFSGGGNHLDIQITESDVVDNSFIDKKNIIQKVKKNIDNYYSDTINIYKSKLKFMYSKSLKNYYIETKNNSIILYSIKDKKKLLEIKKPTYYFIKDKQRENNSIIYETNKIMKTLLNNIKHSLNTEERGIFIDEYNKYKKTYINAIEGNEILRLYYQKINNISNIENVKNVVLQEFFVPNLNNESIIILNGINVEVPTSLIDEINEKKGEQLNTFNEVFKNIKDNKMTKKNLKEVIKKYLINEDIVKLNKKINNILPKQKKYIDYIILELPKIN
jgi:hypothetical protein